MASITIAVTHYPFSRDTYKVSGKDYDHALERARGNCLFTEIDRLYEVELTQQEYDIIHEHEHPYHNLDNYLNHLDRNTIYEAITIMGSDT